MQRGHDEHRRHLAMWVAVGGTMAVIVVLWVLILPMQLSGSRFLGLREASRWGRVPPEDGGDPAPTFEEALRQQGRRLQTFEKSVGLSKDDSAEKIQELRAKIEAAGKKNELPPTTNTNPTP